MTRIQNKIPLKCRKCKHKVDCKMNKKACHYFQRIDFRLDDMIEVLYYEIC